MSYCVKSADNGKNLIDKPTCKKTGKYSNGTIPVYNVYLLDPKINPILKGDFRPNSMAIIYKVLPEMASWSDIRKAYSPVVSKAYGKYGLKTTPEPKSSIGTPYDDDISSMVGEIYLTEGVDRIYLNSKGVKINVDGQHFPINATGFNGTYIRNHKENTIIETKNAGPYCFTFPIGTEKLIEKEEKDRRKLVEYINKKSGNNRKNGIKKLEKLDGQMRLTDTYLSKSCENNGRKITRTTENRYLAVTFEYPNITLKITLPRGNGYNARDSALFMFDLFPKSDPNG